MNDRQLIANLDGAMHQAERHPRGGRRRRTALRNARAFAAEASRRGLDSNVDSVRLSRLRREVQTEAPARGREDDEPEGGRWIFGRRGRENKPKE